MFSAADCNHAISYGVVVVAVVLVVRVALPFVLCNAPEACGELCLRGSEVDSDSDNEEEAMEGVSDGDEEDVKMPFKLFVDGRRLLAVLLFEDKEGGRVGVIALFSFTLLPLWRDDDGDNDVVLFVPPLLLLTLRLWWESSELEERPSPPDSPLNVELCKLWPLNRLLSKLLLLL